MAVEDLERILRWIERFGVDIALTSPLLLNWEMISRVQQYNSAHPQAFPLLSNTGTGYIGIDPATGNKIPLALPSPLQYLLKQIGGGPGGGHGEVLTISVSPLTVSASTGTISLTLAVTGTSVGPFVPMANNTSNWVNIMPGTTPLSAAVLLPGAVTIQVKDQGTGVLSNTINITVTA